jgi:sigma-E factor negative regulatory protein RseC
MEVKAINSVGASVGDRIVLSLETASLLKAAFLIYVFPVILLIAGAALGQALAPFLAFSPSALSVLLGFAFFFTALLITKTRSNRMAKKNSYQPKITKILT